MAQVRGLQSNNKKPQNKDEVVKKMGARMHDWLIIPSNALITMYIITAAAFLIGKMFGLGFYILIIGYFFSKFFLKQHEKAPLKIPIQEKLIDDHQLNPGNGKPMIGNGIFYIGVSTENTYLNKEIWLNNDDTRQHFLVLGTTGSGKTELLTGFAANALSWGSGLIFVDGKGDIKLMATLHALSMRWGRSADFLILNFMPQTEVPAPGEVSSNTMNPYTTSPASDIIQQIGGLMPSSGGDGMWKDRAMTMISAVVFALAWGRDNGVIDLNLAALRKYIQFPNLVSILTDEKFIDLPTTWKNNLEIYLSSLAGYNGTPSPDQGEDCLKQHGFLEMQFTGPLGSLANDYGHIFNSEFGEVDMFDVVLNRRVLVVMLPSLQKMPEDVERMGKIVVASLKTMMGATLGNVGGTKGGKIIDVMKRRVTTAPYPCLVILDEVGYYTVEGMAMMAAQVRSLGFSMIYASQDLKAMTRLNEKEAQSIIANTNTKIVMRTEDAETIDLAIKSGGKGERIRSRSYELGDDIFGGSEWNQDRNFEISMDERIDGLDLKGQGAGEFHILHMDFIVRGKSFYVNTLPTFKKEDDVEVAPNQFIVIKRPDISSLESERKIPEILNNVLDFSKIKSERIEIDTVLNTSPDDEISIVKKYLDYTKTNRSSASGLQENLIFSLACLSFKKKEQLGMFNHKTRQIRRSSEDLYDSYDDEDMPADVIFNNDDEEDDYHGIEINDNGLQDIDSSLLSSNNDVMEAVRGLQSVDENNLDDEEKMKYIRDSNDADISEESMVGNMNKLKDSNDIINDMFNNILNEDNSLSQESNIGNNSIIKTIEQVNDGGFNNVIDNTQKVIIEEDIDNDESSDVNIDAITSDKDDVIDKLQEVQEEIINNIEEQEHINTSENINEIEELSDDVNDIIEELPEDVNEIEVLSNNNHKEDIDETKTDIIDNLEELSINNTEVKDNNNDNDNDEIETKEKDKKDKKTTSSTDEDSENMFDNFEGLL